MGFFSFLHKAPPPGQAGTVDSADAVERERTRARRRLIGAVVLLGLGILGFPLLFETQPRPIAVDIPIEIPRKDAVPPLAMPASRPAPAATAERDGTAARPADAGAPAAAEPGPERNAAGAVAEPSAPAARPQSSPPRAEAAAITKPAPKPATPDDGDRARALLEAKPTAAADAAAEAGKRFIVQVGAYADANAAREARSKVEKLGLKTYTQEVDTDGGKRIRVRVGPFGSRDDADKAAGRIKSAGLPSAILAL